MEKRIKVVLLRALLKQASAFLFALLAINAAGDALEVFHHCS